MLSVHTSKGFDQQVMQCPPKPEHCFDDLCARQEMQRLTKEVHQWRADPCDNEQRPNRGSLVDKYRPLAERCESVKTMSESERQICHP